MTYDLFTSSEAKLQVSFGHTVQTSRERVMKELRLIHQNNQDVAYIYQTKYRTTEATASRENDGRKVKKDRTGK